MPGNAGRAEMPRARALAAALREAREVTQTGLRELARRLQISPTQISNWETGRRVPNIEQVAMILASLRTSPADRENILELARKADEPNWLTAGVEGVPVQLAGVVECERSASTITQWATMTIPGLLQTPEYTREMMQAGLDDQGDIELRMMVRAGRKEVVMRRRNPVMLHALISEAALYETPGDEEVLVDQLDFLLEMGKRSNVVIQIIPMRIGWHPGWSGPFMLYEFPNSPAVVYFEHYSSGAFVPAKHDVAEYRRAIHRMQGLAKSVEESAEFIRKVKDTLGVAS
jgi:DNA-binding XRE family transcriptional regulator